MQGMAGKNIMKVMLLGAAGFIGTNLAIQLSKNGVDEITVVDRDEAFFETIRKLNLKNVTLKVSDFDTDTDFDALLDGQEIVYHLVSTTAPTTCNRQIPRELEANVVMTSQMLEACVRCGVKRVIFISSGGTVYGNEGGRPLDEKTPTYPISSYGVQKITIEKLLYLYRYMYGLDYRVVRLSNPYGPYQRPDGILGAVSTFTYKALRDEEIVVYGDGSIIRDFIYIDDAVRGILNIAAGDNRHRTFNLGSGRGTSIRQLIDTIQDVLKKELRVVYREGRKVDVAMNCLDISRYEGAYGKLNPIDLHEGVSRTAEFMREQLNI